MMYSGLRNQQQMAFMVQTVKPLHNNSLLEFYSHFLYRSGWMYHRCRTHTHTRAHAHLHFIYVVLRKFVGDTIEIILLWIYFYFFLPYVSMLMAYIHVNVKFQACTGVNLAPPKLLWKTSPPIWIVKKKNTHRNYRLFFYMFEWPKVYAYLT